MSTVERKLAMSLSTLLPYLQSFINDDVCIHWEIREGCTAEPRFSIGLNEDKDSLFGHLWCPLKKWYCNPRRLPVTLVTQFLLYHLSTPSWTMRDVCFAQQNYINHVCFLIPNMRTKTFFYTCYLFSVAGGWWEWGPKILQSNHLSSRKETEVNSFASLGRFAFGYTPEQL